jgi:putative FmdB family regulatory protein
MPTYSYHCQECRKNFTVQMSITEHDKAKVKCPRCSSKKVVQQIVPFNTKTSKKS